MNSSIRPFISHAIDFIKGPDCLVSWHQLARETNTTNVERYARIVQKRYAISSTEKSTRISNVIIRV